MPKFKVYKQRQIRSWGKTHHKEGKVNTKMKVILRMNTLMKDDNCAGNADENDVSTSECILTRQVFSSNHQTAKSNTVGGENAEKHVENVFKPQLLEMKLNWIHIITSSKCV